MGHTISTLLRAVAVATPPALAALMAPFPAGAGAPVAIVEDIGAAGAKVGFMDYLERGRTIALGTDGRLVLGYFKSCLRETISGGTVTVGEDRSTAAGGTIKRERVECDGGQMKLTEAQAGKSGVVVMRTGPGGGVSGYAAPSPDVRIYSTRPIITLSRPGGQISIVRLDRPAPDIVIGTTGRFVDLADATKGLAIGGVYRVRAGEKSVVFSVDAFAVDGAGAKAGPALSRFIRL